MEKKTESKPTFSKQKLMEDAKEKRAEAMKLNFCLENSGLLSVFFSMIYSFLVELICLSNSLI